MANKNITIQVGTNVDLSGVKDLESLLKTIGNTPVNLNLKDQELIEAENHLKELKAWAEGTGIDLDVEIQEAEAKVNEIKSRLGQVDDEPITPKVDNIASMEAIEQISQGFDRVRNGATELGQQMETILESAGKQETNKTFLEQSFKRQGKSANEASEAIQGINDTVAKLPGDDSVMQGLLSQALAKDASLTTEQLKEMGTASADYFQAMAYYGKPASEAFQDMNNYLMTGNTAELERSPILANHIDKLKEATSIQERSKVLQEALNEEGWGGMSLQDTYNNKLETFNGMLERGRYNLGGMFQEGAKQGMDFLLKLDESTNGLVGMGIALMQMASPLADVVMGLGQMATGIKAIGELNFGKLKESLSGVGEKLTNVKGKVTGLASSLKSTLAGGFDTVKTKATSLATTLKTNLMTAFTSLKNTMTGTIIPALKSAGSALINLGRSALTAGANALKSAGAWLVQKAQLVASTIATWAQTVANWALNSSLLANPITWVVVALIALAGAFIWAYQNVDWFRQMVDNAWASIVQLGQYLYGVISGAITWVMGLFQQFTSQLGLNTNDWLQAVLGFILFIPQLPLQVGIALVNALAKALGFGNNFVQSLISAGSRAVSGFVNYIRQIPQMVMGEFQRTLQLVNDFINEIPSRVWDMGVAIIDALKSALGIGSPGHMFYMVEGEFNRIDDLTKKTNFDTGRIGQSMVDNFNPNLNAGVDGGLTGATGNNITINIENVDNEERIQQIVQAVEDALKFDALTAGRTV